MAVTSVWSNGMRRLDEANYEKWMRMSPSTAYCWNNATESQEHFMEMHWFPFTVFAAVVVLIIVLICFFRYWDKHTLKKVEHTALVQSADQFCEDMLAHLMPSSQTQSYQFKGLRPPTTLMQVGFNELSLELKNGNQALQGVSGEFSAGSLVAIMGPSGAGKTTFMNVLCGKATYGTPGGDVLINNTPCDVQRLKSVTGFVPQDDIVHEKLTVREQLTFAAKLRNPPRTTRARIENIVEDILAIMQIRHIQNSIVGGVEERGISGGQRKRVNIGLELAADPALLFLDEPTSGLDATSSLLIIGSLKKLTDLGVTIISVIHQPRFSLFTLFDEVLLLGVGGHTVFLGGALEASPYFERLGYVMPNNENPADWLMDCIAGEVKNEKDPGLKPCELPSRWAATSADVKRHFSSKKVITSNASADDGVAREKLLEKQLSEEWLKVDMNGNQDLEESELAKLLRNCSQHKPSEEITYEIMTRIAGNEESIHYEQFLRYIQALDRGIAHDARASEDGSEDEEETDALLLGSSIESEEDLIRERPNVCRQFFIVIHRRLIQIPRMWKQRLIDLILILGCAAVAGVLYRGKMNTLRWENNLPQCLMIMHMGLALLSTVSSLRVFGENRPIFWRESGSGISVAAIFFGRLLLDSFDVVINSFLYTAMFYMVSAPPMQFRSYFIPTFYIGLAASGWGYLISTLVPPQNAVMGGVIFMLTTCGILGMPPNIPDYLVGGVKEMIINVAITRWSVMMTLVSTVDKVLEERGRPCVENTMYAFKQTYNNSYIASDDSWGPWNGGILALVLWAFILRVLAFLGLKFMNRDKQV